MSRQSLLWVGAALMLCSATAAAHGPAPSPLRLLNDSPDHAGWVVTNIGMGAPTTCEVFDYICPVSWGGLETPLSAAVGSDGVIVAGCERDGAPDCEPALWISTDGACSFTVRDELRGERILALASGHGLALGASEHELWWYDVATDTVKTIAPMSNRVDSIVVGSTVAYIAGARPDMTLLRYDRSRQVSTTLTPSLPTSANVQRLTWRMVDPSDEDRAWLVARTDNGVELWRTDDGGATLVSVQVVDDPEDGFDVASIRGPIPMCQGALSYADGAFSWDPTLPSCDTSALTDLRVTCLGHSPFRRWICQLGELHALEDNTGRAELSAYFAIDDLRGPRLACDDADPAYAAECAQNWVHYGGESGLVAGPADLTLCPGEPSRDTGDQDAVPDAGSQPPPTGQDGDGCACRAGGAPTSSPMWFGLAALAVWAVRRRR